MRTLLTILVMAVILFPLTADAIDVSGDQWGSWTKDNSPYNVIGEIPEPEDDAGEVGFTADPPVQTDFASNGAGV